VINKPIFNIYLHRHYFSLVDFSGMYLTSSVEREPIAHPMHAAADTTKQVHNPTQAHNPAIL
jgi:hypothetical protein